MLEQNLWKSVASDLSDDLMSFYHGNQPGGTPGILPAPYYCKRPRAPGSPALLLLLPKQCFITLMLTIMPCRVGSRCSDG